MRLKVYINSNKGILFLVLLGMIAYFRQWNNPTALVYLALHGTYGLLWVMKSHLFPDKQWENKVPLWFGLLAWLALCLYWIPGWIVISKPVFAPAWLLGICVSLFVFGVFFHFVSDMQKHTSLELRPENLITNEMFQLARNINYFGELLVYTAMAMLAMTWLAFLPLIAFIVLYWIPNMVRKENSLARYTDFADYKQKVRLFLPFLF